MWQDDGSGPWRLPSGYGGETIDESKHMRVLVVGATGGIGAALVALLAAEPRVTHVVAWSRTGREGASETHSSARVNLLDEASIAAAARDLGEIDVAIVATGLLHDVDAGIQPEKSWRALDPAVMRRNFEINTIGPALIAKHVLPCLPRDRRAVFAALSARVGSISDNRLGGWYSYRASKAALNQIIRCLSIELAAKRPLAICVGLHPGTVDTGLSKPFQVNVAQGATFSADQSSRHMLQVIDSLTIAQAGCVLDWAGQEISP
ncbi:MAG: SDR family NAD(P)-dependent oxidoreductase [Hyphomicrobiaceae bacterium]